MILQDHPNLVQMAVQVGFSLAMTTTIATGTFLVIIYIVGTG